MVIVIIVFCWLFLYKFSVIGCNGKKMFKKSNLLKKIVKV